MAEDNLCQEYKLLLNEAEPSLFCGVKAKMKLKKASLITS